MTFPPARTAALLALLAAASLTARGARASDALLIQDVLPWGVDAWQQQLDANGLGYVEITSADLGAVTLSDHDVVITSSVQGAAYHSALLAQLGALEAFVQGGGLLVWSAATDAGALPYPDPPFGGSCVIADDNANDVLAPSHALLAGVSDPLTGAPASVAAFSGLPGDAEVMAVHGVDALPTLYGMDRGAGGVIVSGLTLEQGWSQGTDAGVVLRNIVAFAQTFTPCTGADDDGDGWTDCDGDCDDDDPATFPWAWELCDQRDNDCDGLLPADEQTDFDGDGHVECADCDDQHMLIHPDAIEVCNGFDDDCNGTVDDGFDGDGDGVAGCVGDCDDGEPTVYPGAPEICDGLDNDCDGATAAYEIDGDGDGFLACADCDDDDPAVHPDAQELCDDGVDSDCDGDLQDTEIDDDGDGWSECAGDCDDAQPLTHPGMVEICNGGVDDDCDPATDELADVDGDGVALCGGDCDDGDPATYPGADELCDGADNDCDGVADDIDYDGDGYFGCPGGDDCDDHNPSIHAGAEEVPYDGVDQDCDGADLTDVDGDGHDGGAGGTDCNDREPSVWPGAPEDCGDGYDTDCDGLGDPTDPDCEDADVNPGEPVDCSCRTARADEGDTPGRALALAAGLALIAARRARTRPGRRQHRRETRR